MGLRIENNEEELVNALTAIENSSDNLLLSWKAANLGIRVLAYHGNYLVPLSEYAGIINNPPSELDSMFAVIDSQRVALDADAGFYKRVTPEIIPTISETRTSIQQQTEYIQTTSRSLQTVSGCRLTRDYPEPEEITDSIRVDLTLSESIQSKFECMFQRAGTGKCSNHGVQRSRAGGGTVVE